jgi:hypothetical protein
VTSKRFLAYFSAGFIGAVVVVVSANVQVDLYGLFRSAQGRHLGIYGEERIAKYLHSYRYIPATFDGVLFGSSVSLNLDTKSLAGYHVYNASINGGNVSDLKPVAENVFRRSRMKLTVICVHRYLTNDHIQKTDLITPRQYWGALGSPQLLTAYISRMLVRLHVTPNRYDQSGVIHYEDEVDEKTAEKKIHQAVASINQGGASVGNYYVDPVALSDLKEAITTARMHSDRLVILYPPVPEPVLEVRSSEYARYRDAIQGLLDPHDIVVDFNDSDHVSYRHDLRNFIDAVHLSTRGSAAVMAELNRIVGQSQLEASNHAH